MTDPTFTRPGAVDLSGLRAPRPTTGSPSGDGGTRRSWVVVIDESNLEATIRRSMQHPVVLELTSPRAQGAERLSADLAALADAAEGRWLLGRVDCDAHPEIAAALQVQALPTVIGLLGGQALPLFQGVVSREEAAGVLDQLLQAGLANGIAGRAEPVLVETAPGQEVPPRDPRYAAADAAMAAGDFAAAELAFAAVLAESPADTEARIGKAQAGLWARAAALDPDEVEARLAADAQDLQAVLDATDLELTRGRPEAAFTALVTRIRTTFGDDRELLRARLLELFETVDPADPALAKARRDLASALF